MGSDTRVVVLFGGQSAERDVSCVTAAHVLAAIDRSRYNVTAVGITANGDWVETAVPPALEPGDAPLPMSTSGTPVAAQSAVAPASDEQVVVLPLLHGPLGEDGTVQGLLEVAGVPYVGSGVLGSALTMDKAKAKEVLAAHDVPQTKWVTINEWDFDNNLGAIFERLGTDDVFVKPANMGSSVGVSHAMGEAELGGALTKAFAYDEWVVVEETVRGREVEFAVLGNAELRISVPGEIVPGADFYDYEDKYVDGAAKLIIPAELPRQLVSEMEELAFRSYRALRVEGMARADFLIDDQRGPLVNELNTIPGFTPISMYPKMWEASGLSYPELINELIRLALERHQRRMPKRAAGRELSS